MSHSVLANRQCAMRVAIALSAILTPETPLVFEDLDDANDGEMMMTAATIDNEGANAVAATSWTCATEKKEGNQEEEDKNEDNDDNDEDDKDSCCSSDVSLEPYAMSDESNDEDALLEDPLAPRTSVSSSQVENYMYLLLCTYIYIYIYIYHR